MHADVGRHHDGVPVGVDEVLAVAVVDDNLPVADPARIGQSTLECPGGGVVAARTGAA